MTIICDRTHECMTSFFGCFYDNIYSLFSMCKSRDKNINKIKGDIEKNNQTMAEITCSIQNLMKKNIDLRIKEINYL